MKPIGYIYRYDPSQSTEEPVPDSPEATRKELERGNQMFADWVESCRTNTVCPGEPRYVLNCTHLGEVMA